MITEKELRNLYATASWFTNAWDQSLLWNIPSLKKLLTLLEGKALTPRQKEIVQIIKAKIEEIKPFVYKIYLKSGAFSYARSALEMHALIEDRWQDVDKIILVPESEDGKA